MWQIAGRWASLFGGLMFAATLVTVLLHLDEGPTQSCPPKTLPDWSKVKDAAVYVDPHAEVRLNTALCLAVNGKLYFAGLTPSPDPTKTARLFIDDMRTPLSTELYVVDPNTTDGWTWKSVAFAAPQDANTDDAKAWRQILGNTPFNGSRPIRLGLGDSEGKLPRSVAVTPITLRLYHLWTLALGTLGLVLLAGGLILWAWNSGLLRDSPPPKTGVAPFSLGRTQMAWWLVLVTGGFLFIWMVTGQFLHVLTSGALTLVGISGVTGLSAVVIDVVNPTGCPKPSQGFFTDILSDGTTVVLHRVQMFAWTVILGILFLWTAVTTFAFPEFDTGLLVMAGVVNGVYLGFKFPEKLA